MPRGPAGKKGESTSRGPAGKRGVKYVTGHFWQHVGPLPAKGGNNVTGLLRQKGGTALHEVKHVTGSMSQVACHGPLPVSRGVPPNSALFILCWFTLGGAYSAPAVDAHEVWPVEGSADRCVEGF